MTRDEFSEIMGALVLAHPRQQVAPGTLDVYYTVLRDLDVKALQAAVLHLLTESKWFPTIAELRAAAFELPELVGEANDAYAAWDSVLQEIRRTGYSGVPEFRSELVKVTVDRIGGWRNLCMSTNTVADRSRFVQAYDLLLKRERTQTRMLPQVRELALRLSDGGRGLLDDGE